MVKVKGVLAVLLSVTNILVMAIPFFSIVIVKLLIPIKAVKDFCTVVLMPVARRFNLNNVAIFSLLSDIKWSVKGQENLNKQGSYLVVANHQSWSDILVLQAIVEKYVPFLKFFLKKELIWVPILGAAWWALDYPFMKRHSKQYLLKHPDKKGEDLAETKRMCEKFKDAPVSVMNFVEGTRYTPEKHDSQNSPYKHLLRPKVGGAALVMTSLGNSVDTLLDVTINYDAEQPITIWKLYTGQIKGVEVECREIKIPDSFFTGDYENDPEFKREIQSWFAEIWEQKDRRLEEMRQS